MPTPVTITVELFIGGVWVDISTYARGGDGVRITRGRSDEGARTQPSTCTFTLDNRDGRFSPRNPTGPYYGQIGRNTPVRVSAGLAAGAVVRFVGEVSAWPVTWSQGRDARTTVQAAGILRRLGQGAAPIQSAMRTGVQRLSMRGYPYYSAAAAVAYWPMEDGPLSTSMVSGIGGTPMTYVGSPELAVDSSFLSSDPLPKLTTGAAFTGVVPSYTPAVNEITVIALVTIPTALADQAVLLRLWTSGSNVGVVDVYYDAANDLGNGSLGIRIYGPAPTYTLIGDDVQWNSPSVLGENLRLRVNLWINAGTTLFCTASLSRVIEVDTPFTNSVIETTPGTTVGTITSVQVAPNGNAPDAVVGHVVVMVDEDTAGDFLESPANGHLQETAGARIVRLCTEQGVPITLVGSAADTPKMGSQRRGTFLDLITECVEADLGILSEARTANGLVYRTRRDLYTQAVDLALVQGALADLTPVEDDQSTRNDISLTRAGGSSYRATLDTGPLSTQAPPLGIGRYDEAVTINVATDAQLTDQANWRLHLGTVNEARYPLTSVLLHAPAYTSSAPQTAAVLALDQGDRFTIGGMPAWMPPDVVSQLVLGTAETITSHSYRVDINGTPEAPYRIAELDSATNARLDSDTTVTAEALDATETGVDYTGDTWITTATRPGDFPFDIVIGGEAMTVTSATGSTFTVTRSVNGVVKTHATGAEVHVRVPVYLGL